MNVLNVTNGIFYVVCILSQFLKTLTRKNNPLGVRARELLKLIYYSLLGLKSLEKSAIWKEPGPRTSKVSFTTE